MSYYLAIPVLPEYIDQNIQPMVIEEDEVDQFYKRGFDVFEFEDLSELDIPAMSSAALAAFNAE